MTPTRGPQPNTEEKVTRLAVSLYLLPEVNARLAEDAKAAGVAKGEIVERALAAYRAGAKRKGGR